MSYEPQRPHSPMNSRWTRHKRAIYSVIFLSLLLLLFLGGGGYLGLFSSVELSRESRTYRIIGIEHYGSYRKNLQFLRRQVQPVIAKQGLQSDLGPPCAIVFHRFERLPKEERRSVVGYIVESDLDVVPPLGVYTFTAEDAIVVNLHAHKSVAAYRAYRPIREHAQADQLDQATALEIFHEADHVEVIVAPQTAPDNY